MKHLNDEQLQDYLDGKLLQSNGFIDQHLATCPKCRQALKEYRVLNRQLKQEPNFILPPNFSQLVLKSIKRKRDGQFLLNVSYVLIGLLGLLFTAGLSLRYINLESLKNSFSRILPQFALPYLKMVSFSDQYFSLSRENFFLISLTFIILAVIFVIDHFIIQPRFKVR